MRRWIALLISMCMMLSMAACGAQSDDKSGTDGAKATEAAAVTTAAATTEAQSSNKDQALEAADQFMKCLAEGDIDHLGDYCTEDVMEEIKIDELEETFTESFGAQDSENPYTPSEEAKAALKDGVNTILKAVIDRYEFGQIEGEDNQDSYDVPVTVYVRNMEGADDLDINTIMTEIITEEDYAQIMKLSQEEDGQKSMYDYMLVNILPKMFDKMAEEIAKIDATPENSSLTVEKQADGKWLVTKTKGMGSMMPGSSDDTDDGEAPAEASSQQ